MQRSTFAADGADEAEQACAEQFAAACEFPAGIHMPLCDRIGPLSAIDVLAAIINRAGTLTAHRFKERTEPISRRDLRGIEHAA